MTEKQSAHSMMRPAQIRSVTDKAEIKGFLDQDWVYHAYALADLSDPFFEQCRWLAADDQQGIVSLVLIFEALQPPVLFAMGDAAYLPDILASADLPQRASILGQAGHEPHLLTYYQPEFLDHMIRMSMTERQFQPLDIGSAVRLDMSHLDMLRDLYQHFHRSAFAPYQLEQGVFYGIFDDEQLVAAAGTHIIAREYGIAAVGNVATRAIYQGRGYGQQTTSAVCRDLLAQDLNLILNVEENNHSAIHIYKKLGFVAHCQFVEGIAVLKS